MDYQKTEQEKRTNIIDPTTGKQLLYQTTGLSDVIDVYKPIDYAPLGKAATKDDVQAYEDDFLQLHYDLKALKNDGQTKDVEIADKRTAIFTKGEDVQNKKDEHTKAQKHWFELNTELTDVKKKIVKMEAVLAAVAAAATAGLTPPSPVPGATQENLNNGKKKEKELEDDRVTVDADMVTLQAEIATLETEKLQLETTDLKTLQKELEPYRIVNNSNNVSRPKAYASAKDWDAVGSEISKELESENEQS
jgi:peptidoglycan hydrolase CwlO-like protein